MKDSSTRRCDLYICGCVVTAGTSVKQSALISQWKRVTLAVFVVPQFIKPLRPSEGGRTDKSAACGSVAERRPRGHPPLPLLNHMETTADCSKRTRHSSTVITLVTCSFLFCL